MPWFFRLFVYAGTLLAAILLPLIVAVFAAMALLLQVSDAAAAQQADARGRYLATRPAVKNRVPEYQPPAPRQASAR